MQSHKVIASLTKKPAPESIDPARKAELCDALLIMLEEAGTRSAATDACTVIKGILASLQQDYPEIASLVQSWQLLASDTKPAPSAEMQLCVLPARVRRNST